MSNCDCGSIIHKCKHCGQVKPDQDKIIELLSAMVMECEEGIEIYNEILLEVKPRLDFLIERKISFDKFFV